MVLVPSRRLRRLLAAAALALTAALVLAAAAPALLRLGAGQWLEARSGRQAEVDQAALRLGAGRVVLELRGVRVANASWGGEPWMVRAQRLQLRLALTPAPRVEALEADGVRLLLERSEGRANWRFRPRTAPFMSWGEGGLPRIGALRLRDLQVRYRDQAREEEIAGGLENASGSSDGDGPQLRLEGSGVLDRKPFRFSLAREEGMLSARFELGSTRLLLRGTRAGGYRLEAEGGDLREAFPLIPVPFPSTPAYRFEARVVPAGPLLRVRDLRGHLGDTDLAGELVASLAAPPEITASLRSRRLHLADLKGFLGVPLHGPPPRPGKLFPANPVNRERLHRLRLTLDYRADTVAGGRLGLDAVQTRLVIRDGLLRFAPLRLSVADGTAAGEARLDVRPQPSGAALDLDLRGLRLRRLFARLPFLDASRGAIRGRLQLQGGGRSLADIFDHSGGKLVLLMRGGALERRFVDALKGDVGRMLFERGAEDESVEVRCAVAVFQVERGTARAEALVIETAGALITGRGAVDLGRERIDLQLVASPKETSALMAPSPLTLSGTFTRPEVDLDTSGIAGRAAAALALGALLGPLAAVPALIEPGSEEEGDCAELRRRLAPQAPR